MVDFALASLSVAPRSRLWDLALYYLATSRAWWLLVLCFLLAPHCSSLLGLLTRFCSRVFNRLFCWLVVHWLPMFSPLAPVVFFVLFLICSDLWCARLGGAPDDGSSWDLFFCFSYCRWIVRGQRCRNADARVIHRIDWRCVQ